MSEGTARGARLAIDMMSAMQVVDADGVQLADEVQLNPNYHFGRPQRNLVFETLLEARQCGPAAEAAFCNVIGHAVAQLLFELGSTVDDIEEVVLKTTVRAV